MPRFTLAIPERSILISWLFEPNGYLDFAVRVSDGKTAREALAEDSSLDIHQWIRDNELTEPEAAETGMVWWIWKHSGVNITPPTRPPEMADWIAVLERWDASIDAGFNRVPQNERDSNTVPIADETGEFVDTMPAGAQLAHQQSLIRKVLGVLE